MSFLEDLRAMRQKFLDGVDANEGDINLDIFEDFYPDKAHFVFELLQNAEDASATECEFSLSRNSCIFEHNGKKQFSEADVRAITGIHNSTKSKSPDKIGKFGVGFKSVFIYTLTPHVFSSLFSFRIRNLVLPEIISKASNIGVKTRFEFPFNNREKPPEEAYGEIKSGLADLSETVLLFLSHIKAIHWKIEGKPSGKIFCTTHSIHHVEVLKQIGRKKTSHSHFLRFTHPVEGLEKQNVAIAFALDALPNVKNFNSKKPLAKQYRIVPASPGRVAVFFPAEKETSGLRFHLHAPFVPELSRASIKDTPANQPLFSQLADLVVSALVEIRNLRMLTGDFLAVLPNPHDEIPGRYQCIREAINTAMNEQPLTPTHSKSHAPAKNLLQAKASLKKLLTVEDLKYLFGNEEESLRWAIGAKQKNNDVDRFLSGLETTEWGVDDFIEFLVEFLDPEYPRWDDEGVSIEGPDVGFLAWISGKSEEWHQKLYAMLYRELEPDRELGRLEDLCIVLLENGEYSLGEESYFPSDDLEHDLEFPRVAKLTYMSGKVKKEQEDARKLLEAIGVREVGEVEQVKAILKARYSEEAEPPNQKTHKHDLMRFISLVEDAPENARMFKDFWIFERADGLWGKPNQVYIDAPNLETGLNAYYDALGDAAKRIALASSYSIKMRISKKKLAKFAKAVGVEISLPIDKKSTHGHPLVDSLHQDYYRRWTKTMIDLDWFIQGLEELLLEPSEALSKLVWNTLKNANPEVYTAKFRPNREYPLRSAPSSLVIELQQCAWVPQGTSSFVRPAEASRDLLPEGFPYDKGWSWLEDIHFGKEIERQSKEHQRKCELAIELGFNDDDSLNDAKRFAALDPEERQRILSECESRGQTELPDHESPNPERRASRVRKQADEAPDRGTEKRTRSVSVEREAVKKETVPYLRHLYQNSDGEMICQVCKDPLPFKLEDGNYYFEAVEFLTELRKRHYQNYLALCPNHAAMYRHANGTRELKNLFLAILDNELDIVLAGQDTSIRFKKNHILDLKTIIGSDDSMQVK